MKSLVVPVALALGLVPVSLTAQGDAPDPSTAWEVSARGTWSTLHHAHELIPGVLLGVFGDIIVLPSQWPASEGGFGWEAVVRRDLGDGFVLGVGAGDQRQGLETGFEDDDPGARHLDLFEVFGEVSYRLRIGGRGIEPLVGLRAGRFAFEGRLGSERQRFDATVETSGFDLGWFAGALWRATPRLGVEAAAMYSVYLMSEVTVTGISIVEGSAGDGTALGARVGIVIRIP